MVHPSPQDPELHEVFNIRLVNVSGGATLSTSGNTVSTVTVRANDFPYGVFVFSTEFRPLSVSEGVGSVEVRVTREFGTLGTVMVDFATIPSDDVGTSSVLTLAGIDVDGLIENRWVQISCGYVMLALEWLFPQPSFQQFPQLFIIRI